MKKTGLFLLALLVLQGGVATAQTENVEKGTGGDGTAIEFKSIAVSLVTFTAGTLFDLTQDELSRFKAAVESARVESTDDVLQIDGAEKTAINYSDEKLIRVNRRSWLLLSGLEAKVRLVSHEYFGIAGIADFDFKRSSQIPVLTTSTSLNFGAMLAINYIDLLLNRIDAPNARDKIPTLCWLRGKIEALQLSSMNLYLPQADLIDIDRDLPLEERLPARALTFGSTDTLTQACENSSPLNPVDIAQARASLLQKRALLVELGLRLQPR